MIVIFLLVFGISKLNAQGPCDADHTVLLINYEFSPSELTIVPGETVAFINIEGTHDVNGVTNSITGEPFNNPEDFYLNETIGTTAGTCMGVITFSIPGRILAICWIINSIGCFDMDILSNNFKAIIKFLKLSA